ncbi:hypothetical protein P7C73_g60, partial [Tremellales sp. Uapishka_1]
MPKPIPIPYEPGSEPSVEEEANVHQVYEKIAPHFSLTRFKPWPLIESFLQSQPPNSLGLDSGAGNGKYLPVAIASGSRMIALDRSEGLLGVARTQGDVAGGSECVRGDLCHLGWRDGVFDFAISIAAIHHLSTPDRRRLSVQALFAPLVHSAKPPYSRFFIYVWAYEQSSSSRRKMGATADQPSPAEEQEPNTKIQDVLVPWVTGYNPKKGEVLESPPEVLHRYYHLFVEGELRALVEQAGREEGYVVVDEVPIGGSGKEGDKWLRIRGVGYEADNWWLEGEVGLFSGI